MSDLVKKLLSPILITSSLVLCEPLFNFQPQEIFKLNNNSNLTSRVLEEENSEFSVKDILKKQGYLVESVNEIYEPEIENALIAFQKVHKLKLTGKVNEEVLSAMKNPIKLGPKYEKEEVHIEIDLSKQLLYFVENAEIKNIIHVSTGKAGARTPKGIFEVYELEKNGWRKGTNRRGEVIGILYNPIKFYKTYYIHGSDFVPLYSASAGCVRVEPYHADFLQEKVKIGTEIIIY